MSSEIGVQALRRIHEDEEKTMTLKNIVSRWRRAAASRRNSLEFLELFNSPRCNVRGVVVYAHGSGGLTVNNMRFMRMLAAEGFIVIAPDDMAGAVKQLH